jgi:hypothetical protein
LAAKKPALHWQSSILEDFWGAKLLAGHTDNTPLAQ